MKKPEPDEIAPSKGGRPRALQADAQTLKMLRAWSSIMCTEAEAASVLSVSLNTFKKFLADYPEAQAAFDEGRGQGRMSLRRKQFALAEKIAAVAIFLGKNYLGQSDRQEHSGPNGGPIRHQHDFDLSALTDEELALLDAIQSKLDEASAPHQGDGADGAGAEGGPQGEGEA